MIDMLGWENNADCSHNFHTWQPYTVIVSFVHIRKLTALDLQILLSHTYSQLTHSQLTDQQIGND